MFKKFRKAIQDNFANMCKQSKRLYEVELDKDELWNLYLDSYPAGTNEVFRVRREYDCSCCRHFVKSVGNVVAIIDGKVRTIWDINLGDTTYQSVANALAEYVKSKKIVDVFLTKETHAGTDHSNAIIEDRSYVFDHFYLDLPSITYFSGSKSVESGKAVLRDNRNVFKRSLDEITMEAVDTVLELISQNSLYKGAENKSTLMDFKKAKKEYEKITGETEKELYAWKASESVPVSVAKIRNTSIGTLLVDISNGVDLDGAVTAYERMVAPENYKRPKAIFTQKMLDDAKKTITELGYMESLERRHACLDDITVNNILFSNKDASKRITGAMDVFDDLSKQTKGSAKKFSKVEEVTIQDFVDKVLPTATSIEAYVENEHLNNFVSLVAPVNMDSKSMFKWGNNFGWAYTGNLTDSAMKDRVKAAGGNVTGDLRFSIQWNEDGKDNCDLDAHCIEANNDEIYYGSYRKPSVSKLGGQLDVDIISPGRHVAVENITYANKRTMRDGTYKFFVRQFSGSVKNGFRAEIEFDGKIYSFDYPNKMRTHEDVYVADVTLKNGVFTITEKLPSSMSSKEKWGIKTNDFTPVTVVMMSPNYWDGNGDVQDAVHKVGNKHYFFMLKDCVNDENPNAFYNEFLKDEIVTHKRVFEALGSKLHVQDAPDQLSGLGFSSTRRSTDKPSSLVVKVKGSTERTMRITF